MEIHICSNCEVIEEILEKKNKRWNLLSEENLTLHSLLQDTRKLVEKLQREVSNLHVALAEEREINLKNYLIMQIRNYKQIPTQSEAEADEEQADMWATIAEQKRIYEEQFQLLVSEKEYRLNEMAKHQKLLHDHSELLIEEATMYKRELSLQRTENTRLSHEFRDTVRNLTAECDKHYKAKLDRKLKSSLEKCINSKNGIINSLRDQLEQRDELVDIMRHQRKTLQEHNDVLKAKERQSRDDLAIQVEKLRLQNKQCREIQRLTEHKQALARSFATVHVQVPSVKGSESDSYETYES